MAFDGEKFIERFNTVWNGHDLDGIIEMMTDDVIFEASVGKDPWGARVTGTKAVREFLTDISSGSPTSAGTRCATSPARRSPRRVGDHRTPRGAGRYEVHGCDILTLRAGKIAAKRSYRKATLMTAAAAR